MTMPDDGGFDAEDVEPLSYNFSKWLSHDKVQVAGGKRTIPEPSTEAVTEFGVEYDRLMSKLAGLDLEEPNRGESPDEHDERIERNLVKAAAYAQEHEDQRAAIFAKLCSDTPTAEELMKLPHRVRRAFFGYILRSINPQT